MEKADIVVHCTPVGMHPKEDVSLVPAQLFRPGQAVFDIVYTPLETKLLADARARGLQTISGVEMFINQAVLQFEKFTGRAAPEEVMPGGDGAAEKMNIVLIGYRGTGKSQVGGLLAERLRMRLVGMDAAIVRSAGMTIPQIVEREGWRALATAKVPRRADWRGWTVWSSIPAAASSSDRKISRRYAAMRASSGCRLRYRRSSPASRGDGRPALTAGKTFTGEVAEVLEKRTPRYREAADHAIETDELTPRQIVDRIVELLGKTE